MKFRKLLTALVIFTSMLTAVTSCGGGSGGGDDDDGSVTLKFYGWGSAEEQQNFQIMINSFMAQNTDIKVVYEASDASTYVTNLRGKANSLPDVFYMPDYEFIQYAYAGRLLDISSYLTQEEIDSVWEESIDMYRFDRTTLKLGEGSAIYGLPKDLGPYNLVFNKTLMKQYIAEDNIDISMLQEKFGCDEEGLPNRSVPMSWDNFVEYLKLFKGHKNGSSTVYPIGYYDPLHAVYSNNADFWSEDTTTSRLTDQNLIDALQWIADLGLVHGIAPTGKDVNSSNGYQKFINQTGLITFMGAWDQKTYWKDLTFDFDIMPTPYGPAEGAKSTSWMGSVAISVKANWGTDAASQKKKEAAVKLAKYLTLSEENSKQNYLLGQAVPNVKSIAKTDFVNNVGLGREEYKYRDVMPQSKQVWVDVIEETDDIKHHLRSRYYIWNNSLYNDLISDISSQVNTGNKTAKEFVDSYNKGFQDKLTKSYEAYH